MHSELKQYLRLAIVILSVIFLASLGLVFDSLNGLAWLLATPIVVGVFLWYRHLSKETEKQ